MAWRPGHPRGGSTGAIAIPPLGALLRPFVTEAIFLLLVISFMRVDLAALRPSTASTSSFCWSSSRP
jgi:hypothetical protein